MKKLILSLGAKLAVLYELLQLKLLKGLGFTLPANRAGQAKHPTDR